MAKTLNDHLFEQLDRISKADSDNINLEVSKANAIISVSEQILNAAKFKMDIVKSNCLDQFTEIDAPNKSDDILKEIEGRRNKPYEFQKQSF